jgi:cystathionine gamma-synthase
MRIETIAVHAGAEVDSSTGAVAPPIHLSTTFEHGPASQETHGYTYVRERNPTQSRLEDALTKLEGGDSALVFSSGMAAGAAILQTLQPRSHVLFPDDMYATFRQLYREFLPNWGIESSVVNMGKLTDLKRAIRENTKLIWLETPSNPLLKISDIQAISEIAHVSNAMVLVDNTFATPLIQRPFTFNADIVLHSATKYFGGHSDVQGGALVLGKDSGLPEKLLKIREVLGSVSSPFNSWLVLRGLRTLPCRIEKHSSNALAVADALEKITAVERVYYPGLASHPGHDIAQRQMRQFGGMLSFQVKGGRDQAVKVASKLKLFVNATSLGGTESLVEHRASMEGEYSTAPSNLLRLSVGLEHPDDLIEDLLQAMK